MNFAKKSQPPPQAVIFFLSVIFPRQHPSLLDTLPDHTPVAKHTLYLLVRVTHIVKQHKILLRYPEHTTYIEKFVLIVSGLSVSIIVPAIAKFVRASRKTNGRKSFIT